MQNLNPQGRRFPKFISFQDNTVQFTLMRSADVKRLMQGSYERIQRYLMPDSFLVQKKTVRWRRRKLTKVYNISSHQYSRQRKSLDGSARPSLDATQSEEFALDYTYVVSLHYARSCDVLKDSHLYPELEEMSHTLKHVIETYVLAPLEVLEEFIFSAVKGQDSRWHFLSCSRCRISESTEAQRQHKSLSIVELTSRIANRDAIDHIHRMPLPDIDPRSMAETFSLAYSPAAQPPVEKTHHARHHSDVLILEHIDSVATKFDHLRQQSQVLKRAHNAKQVVKFAEYDPGFLGRIIKKMYDAVLRDSKLAKYYHNKEKVQTKIAGAVTHVIQNGTTKMNMRKIHHHLGITDSDFDLYVYYFLAALQSEKAKPEDVTATEVFLEDFRSDIVTRRAAED